MSPDRDAVVVTAGLRVTVTDPRGREAGVVLSDRDGTLVVELVRLPVLVASLPGPVGSPAAALRWARSVLGDLGAGVAWDQPVDVLVDGRLLLRRHAGRWRPAPRVVAPAIGAAAGLVAAVAAFVVTVTAVRRAVRR